MPIARSKPPVPPNTSLLFGHNATALLPHRASYRRNIRLRIGQRAYSDRLLDEKHQLLRRRRERALFAFAQRAEHVCSPAVMQSVIVLRKSTACWGPPNSMATIPKRFCAKCSRESPNIQSPVSTSCCPGICRRRTPLRSPATTRRPNFRHWHSRRSAR